MYQTRGGPEPAGKLKRQPYTRARRAISVFREGRAGGGVTEKAELLKRKEVLQTTKKQEKKTNKKTTKKKRKHKKNKKNHQKGCNVPWEDVRNEEKVFQVLSAKQWVRGLRSLGNGRP